MFYNQDDIFHIYYQKHMLNLGKYQHILKDIQLYMLIVDKY